MRSNRIALASAILFVAIACRDNVPPPTAPAVQRAASPPGSRQVSRSHPIPGEWVVQLKQGTVNPRGVMNALLRGASGAILKSEHLDIAGAFVLRIPDAAASALAANPNVRSVSPNLTLQFATTQTSAPWALDRIDQHNRPGNGTFSYPSDGLGTHIYLVDTGILTDHPDFGGRATGDVSTAGDNIGTLDGCGHGVAVAGLAGATTYGVAKGARLHAVKVMDKYCIGDVSSFLYGIQWIRDNHINPSVVNSSLQFGGVVTAIDSAVRSLINTTGIEWVQAAGNNSDDACNYSPAGVTEALVVASVDSFDIRTAWSATGSCVDLYAPGVDLLTTWYDYWNAPNVHNALAYGSGTSFSAPLVTGVVASYLQRNPTASPATIHSFIISTATSGVVQSPGAGTPNLLLYQQPTAPITVSLSGPTSVRPNTQCLWTASASGGAGALNYSWFVNGGSVQSGPSTDLIWSLSSASTVSVTVSDGYQNGGQASTSVTVSSGAPMCRF